MTATPPPSPDEDSATSERARKAEARTTWLLLGGLLLVAFVAALWTSFGIHACEPGFAACNETVLGISNALTNPGVWVIFAISLIVSMTLLNQGRRAYFVPLIGATAIICAVMIEGLLRDAAITF